MTKNWQKAKRAKRKNKKTEKPQKKRTCVPPPLHQQSQGPLLGTLQLEPHLTNSRMVQITTLGLGTKFVPPESAILGTFFAKKTPNQKYKKFQPITAKAKFWSLQGQRKWGGGGSWNPTPPSRKAGKIPWGFKKCRKLHFWIFFPQQIKQKEIIKQNASSGKCQGWKTHDEGEGKVRPPPYGGKGEPEYPLGVRTTPGVVKKRTKKILPTKWHGKAGWGKT